MRSQHLSLWLLVLAAACAPGSHMEELTSPAGEGSGEPYLSSYEDGLVLSWLQRAEEGGHDLRIARLGPDGWDPDHRVAHGEDFFVNWADFPSAAVTPDGTFWAHWLVRQDAPGLAYDIRLASSPDGGATWSEAWTPHEDGTPTEHGFVTLFPTAEGIGLTWLDGRKYAPGADGAPPAMEMTLRSRTTSAGGEASPERVVDDRTCDCCQTDVAVTSTGPVVVYRDRTEDEVRDVFIARWDGDGWAPGAPVHDDGWVINACPVNGPAVDADGALVAVAWFTGAGDEPRVQVAFSEDGGETFTTPVRVDDGNPVGRVDLRLLSDGSAAVAWLERVGGEGAEIRLARIRGDGRRGEPLVLTQSSAARAAGFPRMARLPWGTDALAVSWTDVSDGDRPRVRLFRVELGS